MKYVVILPDGATDLPIEELGGSTPLAAAQTPHMDRIASAGVLGRIVTVPHGYDSGTDVGTLSLLGFDPDRYYTGRAPLEAAAQGIEVADDELIFRCNFVTLESGKMRDFTADHIEQPDADRLIGELNELFEDDPVRFYSGVSYRNLMVMGGGAADFELKTSLPHNIHGQSVAKYLPAGHGSDDIRALMFRAAAHLRNHPINQARREAGRPTVSDIWLWGEGRPAALEPYPQRYGVRGVVITAVDIIRGLCRAAGIEIKEVPGATGYIDTDYAAKGQAAIEALQQYDLVLVHIEAPDEAAHMGSAAEKVKALEQIDQHIVGPLLVALEQEPRWRMMIAPDHPTLVSTRAHAPEPPIFSVCEQHGPFEPTRRFCEVDAEQGVYLSRGYELMGTFLDPDADLSRLAEELANRE
jgi:2,3-bisphosphoglycerate-independent phosphoglycerate mutase